jgi:hypothetical protein
MNGQIRGWRRGVPCGGAGQNHDHPHHNPQAEYRNHRENRNRQYHAQNLHSPYRHGGYSGGAAAVGGHPGGGCWGYSQNHCQNHCQNH